MYLAKQNTIYARGIAVLLIQVMFVTNSSRHNPLGGFGIITPQRTFSPSWMDGHDSIFNFMVSPEFVSNSLWDTPSHCCRGSAAQGRDMACKLKEIKHREAMKRQAEIERKEKRLKEQRRRQQKALQEEKRRLRWTVLDDSQTHLTVGARMDTTDIGADNVQIKGHDGHITIHVTKNVPVYRRVHDIFGNVALQRCATKKEHAWSETVDVDPLLDVEHVSATLYNGKLVLQIPYKQTGKEIPIESSTREDTEPSTDSDVEPEALEHQDAPEDNDIPIHVEYSPRKSDKDVWEELDGSIEDCEYE